MTENDGTWIQRRRELLDEGNRLHAQYQQLGPTSEGMDAFFRSEETHDEYRRALPEVVVSRCPITDVIIRWPLDTIDLDGWGWEWDNPTRRLVNPVPATWLAMGGAMRLKEPLASVSFECMPGPDAPYVIPRLLDLIGVRAVIAEVPVGRHTGWAVTYFCLDRPSGVPLENLWGSKTYDVYDNLGHWRAWSEHLQTTREYDFNLRPWLDSGKVAWIAPGDDTATLREGSADCPYLDIKGDHQLQLIYEGKVTKLGHPA